VHLFVLEKKIRPGKKPKSQVKNGYAYITMFLVKDQNNQINMVAPDKTGHEASSFLQQMEKGPKGHHATIIQRSFQQWQGSQRVLGTLKKIHGDNGFCSVDGVADDVLLGSRSLKDCGLNLQALQLGDSLTFEIAMGAKGYHAINIQENHVGRRVIGKLKKIHGDNGFCSVEGVADDVLLGSRTLKDCGVNLQAMQLGDSLTFEIAMGPKGYHAIDIQESNVGKRVIGKLKKIHGGNGFCSVKDVAGDVLLGSRSLNDCGVNLQLGDYLSFEIAMGAKGFHAIDIQQEPEGE